MSAPVDVYSVVDGPADAPVLVLSPSLGTTAAMWEPLVAELAEHRRVLRYDPRGHGRSPVPPPPYEMDDLADDVVRLLDAREVASADYCGVSLGGMAGIALAARHPDRVRRLMVSGTSALLGPPEMWRERAETVRGQGTAAIADTVVSRWVTADYAAGHPEVVGWLKELLASTPAGGYAACCGAIERMDLRAVLPRIDAPTLVLVGREDPATPPEHAEQIAAGVRGARLEVLSPAAHLANVEQPAAFTRLLLDHLASG